MLPPDSSRRSRAASASIVREERDDRDASISVRGRQRVVDLCGRRTARGGDDPSHAISELLVRGHDVDHEVPVGLSEPDHRNGRDRVEDELLCCSGLEPRRSGEELGPDDDGDLVVDERAELGVWRRDDAYGEGACARGRVECAENVGRGAARADAHDGVDGAELERRDLVGAASRDRLRRRPGRAVTRSRLLRRGQRLHPAASRRWPRTPTRRAPRCGPTSRLPRRRAVRRQASGRRSRRSRPRSARTRQRLRRSRSHRPRS